MPHESDLLIDALKQQQQKYHEMASADARPSELKAVSEGIQVLKDRIAASICGPDCPPCPKCKSVPIGMLKRPAYTHLGTPHPPTYEIGCCGLMGRGWTPEMAREEWAKRIEE